MVLWELVECLWFLDWSLQSLFLCVFFFLLARIFVMFLYVSEGLLRNADWCPALFVSSLSLYSGWGPECLPACQGEGYVCLSIFIFTFVHFLSFSLRYIQKYTVSCLITLSSFFCGWCFWPCGLNGTNLASAALINNSCTYVFVGVCHVSVSGNGPVE